MKLKRKGETKGRYEHEKEVANCRGEAQNSRKDRLENRWDWKDPRTKGIQLGTKKSSLKKKYVEKQADNNEIKKENKQGGGRKRELVIGRKMGKVDDATTRGGPGDSCALRINSCTDEKEKTHP